MPLPINNEDDLEAFAELHRDVLGGCRLRLKAYGMNVFTDTHEGHSVKVVRAHPIDCTFTVILEIHRDWLWLVYQDQDSPDGLKDVTRWCSEAVVPKKVTTTWM
ncbi:hypothetical protein ACFX15_022554 [Malus domestica]